MPDDKVFEKGMAHLKRQAAEKGIGSLRVDDGQIFLLTKEFVQGMLDQMELDDNDELIMFVAQGPLAKDMPDGNN